MLLLLNIFFLFFLFDIRYVRTLSELKFLGNIQSLSIILVLILMSFAGVPPLLGFTGKFLIFITLLNNSSWIFVLFFGIVNIFLIYFYIQNFRFVVPKKIYDKSFYKFSFKKSSSLVNLIVLLSTLNLFGVLYIEEFFIYFNFISSNMFF
jgi:NADH:ubiquinone oxidoreductase subunit 2 (subunit N)